MIICTAFHSKIIKNRRFLIIGECKGFELDLEYLFELMIYEASNISGPDKYLLVFASDVILIFNENLEYMNCIYDDQIGGAHSNFVIFGNKIYSGCGYSNVDGNEIKCWDIDQYLKCDINININIPENSEFELKDDIYVNVIANDKFLYAVGKPYLYTFDGKSFNPVLW